MPLAKRTVAEIQRQGVAAPDRNPVVRVTPGTCAWRYQGVWRLVRDEVAAAPPAAATQATPPAALKLPAGTLWWQPASEGVAAGGPLNVRLRRGGESLPTAAGTRTVKALFQQNRVPPWLRPSWPLLFDGDQLVAVPNLGLAASRSRPNGWMPIWTPDEREIDP